MLYLILITFGVFLLFWIGDFYLTIRTVKKLGSGIEINPILKVLLRGRGRLIYLFKPIELIAFLYLVWVLSKFEGSISFNIILWFIFIYSLIVINNAHVYYKATSKESIAFKMLFFGLTLACLLFIYLNYMLYLDLRTAYIALDKSNDKYNELYASCYFKDAMPENSSVWLNTEIPEFNIR